MEDALINNKIKSLSLKGFSKEEIVRLLDATDKQVNDGMLLNKLSDDININSVEYYSELQKDLSKLVMTELSKETRDSNVVLNAIKLQAGLQEKKFLLGRKSGDSKISKDYIFERDVEIVKCVEEGMSEEKICKKFNIGAITIAQAIDRTSLNLPEELKELSPSVISETKGLGKERRLKLLQHAYDEKLNRTQIRKIVNEIKNEER